MKNDVQSLANKAHEVCRIRGWKRDWKDGGIQLHLEASEFIEALRGKGKSTPAEEAGDVLFVLLSMITENGTMIQDVLNALDEKCEYLKTAPRYKGEQFDPSSTLNSSSI